MLPDGRVIIEGGECNQVVANYTTTSVETGDFDGDGKSDILWRDSSGNVAIWFMNGVQASGAGVGNVPAVWSIQGANAD